MKTSHYILISFFGFIIAAMLILYTDSLKVNKNNRVLDYNSAGKIIDYNGFPSKELGTFSAIVAESDADILVMQDSINSVISWYLEDGYSSELPNYKIINDTLFVSKTDAPAQTIIRCQSLHSIIGQNNSSIFVKNFSIDSLSFNLDGSRVNVAINDQSVKSLEMIGKNKSVFSFQINQSDIGDIQIDVNDARLDIFGNGDFQNVIVNLQNNALLNLQGKRSKLTVESDASSTYNVYNR